MEMLPKPSLRVSGRTLGTPLQRGLYRDLLRTRMLRFDRWILIVGRRKLVGRDGSVVVLSNGEYRLLMALLDHPGVVLGRERLLELTTTGTSEVFNRSVDRQIGRLRRKIERDPVRPTLVRTHYNTGYSIAADVEQL